MKKSAKKKRIIAPIVIAVLVLSYFFVIRPAIIDFVHSLVRTGGPGSMPSLPD